MLLRFQVPQLAKVRSEIYVDKVPNPKAYYPRSRPYTKGNSSKMKNADLNVIQPTSKPRPLGSTLSRKLTAKSSCPDPRSPTRLLRRSLKQVYHITRIICHNTLRKS